MRFDLSLFFRPLCLRNGARETREKTRKGMRGVGWEAHVTSRDPTLDAVGTRSCAIRRGMSKKRATAIFDLSLRVGRPSELVNARRHSEPQRDSKVARVFFSVGAPSQRLMRARRGKGWSLRLRRVAAGGGFPGVKTPG